MDNFKLPKIGLRTIKSAIAVFLCLTLLPHEPFFACLTAIICLQDTVANSIHMAIDRGGGTILGGIIGLLFLYVCRFIDYNINNIFTSKLFIYLLISVGIITIIYICNVLKRPGAINVSCIVFLAITTTHAYNNPLYYAANRAFETFIGIIISILVNTFITPPSK
jgi:uncharacterized membrane protein YgaE (UPF0421/DUF939 family)